MCRRGWGEEGEGWRWPSSFEWEEDYMRIVAVLWITFSSRLMCQIIGSGILIRITHIVPVEVNVHKDVI
ncbi:hypothetical protein TSUD_99380 [Trifolium subterraneum]|uniref:Uncharacterized protein n=1 Tax=Trifolium subterraneum TaxID=3900 RepID=A0A2Z6LQW1_TRISU|nr:hypothetical protein TSUD_99380 [Trifolium subterraneum]